MTEEEKKELQANFDRVRKGVFVNVSVTLIGLTLLAGLILMTKSK